MLWIKAESSLGISPRDAIVEAIGAARRTGLGFDLKFNGVSLRVDGDDDPDAILARYSRIIGRRSERGG